MTNKKKKTFAQLEAELKSCKANKLLGMIEKVAPHLIRWGGLVLIAYFADHSIENLSGKSTLAMIDLNAAASFNAETPEACEQNQSAWLSWTPFIFAILAIAGVAYGFRQKDLRKLTIEQLTPYKERFERQNDPNRSSSGLLNDGSTRHEDR